MPFGTGANLAQSAAWRGRCPDITGYVWLGARYYNPESGSFLSSDPAWNGRDPNYFTFAGGDPINGFDPDGRLAKNGLAALTAGSAYLEEKIDNWSINSPEKVRDYAIDIEQAKAQQQWFLNL